MSHDDGQEAGFAPLPTSTWQALAAGELGTIAELLPWIAVEHLLDMRYAVSHPGRWAGISEIQRVQVACLWG